MGGVYMKNLFIDKLNEKSVESFTSDFGLYLRKIGNTPFKKACNIFTNAHIIKEDNIKCLSDEEYYHTLSDEYVPLSTYDLRKNKNNIVLERYPILDTDISYIFVCNHTCPEDIETVLNVLDRNAYLVLGSIESLQYNREMYLSWLNGMIPFDIMDKVQRKELLLKMQRVLETNSILIFPEGSHNYHPNKLINNLFDGPVNLALKTMKKIVIITLVRDDENNVSYIDVGNPIDIKTINVDMNEVSSSESEFEKYYVRNLSLAIRDKMATAVYYLISRHFKVLNRNQFSDMEEFLRNKKIIDAFQKLKWKHDVFEAEYLVKKTAEEKEFEAVIKDISNLRLNIDTLKSTTLDNRYYVLSGVDLERKDIPLQMRKYWLSEYSTNERNKKLVKK